jgi:hypothetical protein
MDIGLGGGSEVLAPPDPTDDVDAVLQAMVRITGDASIATMLEEHREFKTWRTQRDEPKPVAPMAAMPEQVEEDFDDELGGVEVSGEFGQPSEEPDDDLATEEEAVPAGEVEMQTPVETPAEPPPVEGGAPSQFLTSDAD